MSSTKIVQTELDMETYRALKAMAVDRGVPLKEILREILREYAESAEKEMLREVHEDPLWKGIGLLKRAEKDESEKDEWGTVEWSSE
ncbi:hypothetical protein [Palaeococcus ferrophilus]|uniref:hypothetical protein n=1 Tax=Palaeococcus ferrophilus TaxID=83868 RepID=UPI00064F381E|nr:hypothetical protein [Palaeococcus ferrophilus]